MGKNQCLVLVLDGSGGICKRHGIRNLSFQSEKLSANSEAGKDFVSYFSVFIETSHLSMDQIFNCDETGLNFRLLPDKTLAASFETSADGRKKSKERVNINTCSNASGTIKLPLQVIGKANRPRCFKSVRMDLLPVEYYGKCDIRSYYNRRAKLEFG